MKKTYIIVGMILLVLVASFLGIRSSRSISSSVDSATEGNNETQDTNEMEGSSVSFDSKDGCLVELLKVNDNVWVHRSYYKYGGEQVPSNGLVVLTSENAVLIDTPWTNEQTKALLTLIKERFNKEVGAAYVTHAHMDRIGGIDALLDKQINVQSTALTAEKAVENGFTKPDATLDDNMLMTIGGVEFEFYYPGKGHTEDNMILWLPDSKILYGACFIKSLDSESIGNIADASLSEWPDSLKDVQGRYEDADIVIPGHGEWGGMELIDHTLELVKKNQNVEIEKKIDAEDKRVIQAINDTAFSKVYTFDCVLGDEEFSGVQRRDNNLPNFELCVYLDRPVQGMEEVMMNDWGRGYTEYDEDGSFSAGVDTELGMLGIGPSLHELPITQINRFAMTTNRLLAIREIVKVDDVNAQSESYKITFEEDSEWSSQEMVVEIDKTTNLLKEISVTDEPDYYGERSYRLTFKDIEL